MSAGKPKTWQLDYRSRLNGEWLTFYAGTDADLAQRIEALLIVNGLETRLANPKRSKR